MIYFLSQQEVQRYVSQYTLHCQKEQGKNNFLPEWEQRFVKSTALTPAETKNKSCIEVITSQAHHASFLQSAVQILPDPAAFLAVVFNSLWKTCLFPEFIYISCRSQLSSITSCCNRTYNLIKNLIKNCISVCVLQTCYLLLVCPSYFW